MEKVFESLTNLLLQHNRNINEQRARTWVELLWEDFETTYAKAGYQYKGKEVTEKVVRQWITQYGSKLHEFAALNPKYAHLLTDDEELKH